MGRFGQGKRTRPRAERPVGRLRKAPRARRQRRRLALPRALHHAVTLQLRQQARHHRRVHPL